ncbi:hypothetical protein [Seonamhaeicola marinus]|uniref:Lipocalin family protein n=1 Tax=Seonamhaeicola marinus TaxID=1912246 RepID=A0A5D0HU97_9FLAO|nr:hypothetical protein [Seonamhaeicola marinus]TYA74888.1 hypothetical protein FUA24_16425 [Seonamhaeicola marinus]
MKKRILLLALTLGIMSVQCSDNGSVAINEDNLLIGNWVEPNYSEEKTVYKRAASLPNEAYGISFKEDGSLVERSSGWCGTPPLTFFNINGSWELDGTLIELTKEDYPSHLGWRIVSLTHDELVVKREITEQEKDHRDLMDLYNEIYLLSLSEDCLDENEWTYTAYGAKACGGPQGYIAYSNNIDTEAFLEKIEEYTNLEKAYNIKWSIVSTCDLPQQPSGVECVNGYPVLKY